MRNFLNRNLILLGILLSMILLAGCQEDAKLTSDSLALYLPMETGKYIIYRVDSTVFTQFGRQTETHSYLVKCQIDSSFADNLGRNSYRILRTIRDTLETTPWKNAGSFFVTPGVTQVEWIEDNLRQIKLQYPIHTTTTWKGNRYLSSNPLNPPYDFSNDDNMPDWNFEYAGSPASVQYRDQLYNEVITIKQIDRSFNVPITLPGSYAFKNFAIDRFAKNIGLVYKEWECWEYQPNTGGSGGPYRIGFGIRQWMVAHN